MPQFSQNQKVVAVFILSSLAATGIFFSLRSIRDAGRVTSLPGPSAKLASASDDADSDGLLDKEELETFRTDPQNPDTDGDGLFDGLEIALGSDPTASEITEAAGRIAAAEARGETNATALLLDELFSRVTEKAYVYAPDENTAELHSGLGPADIEQLVTALQTPLASLVPQVTIRDEEIKISENLSEGAVVAYVRSALTALEPAFGFPSRDLAGLPPQQLLEHLTSEFLPRLKTADNELVALAVPKSFRDLHKELLQLVRLEVSLLQNLKAKQDDVLAAYIHLATFERTTSGWVLLRKKVVEQLDAQKIKLPDELATKLLLPTS